MSFKYILKSLLLATCLSSLAAIFLYMTPWVNILFFNGDSLFLPLVFKSISVGEAFSWKFGSQYFLFPELLLYSISWAVASSPGWSLLINGILSLILLYMLTLFLSLSLAVNKKNSLMYASLILIFFIFYVALEPWPDVNKTSLAMPSMIVGYYFGVIITSIMLLILTNKILINPVRFKNIFFLISILFGLSYFSNPLMLLQAYFPFLAVATLIVLRKIIPISFYFRLMTFLSFGLLSGHLLRDYLTPYSATSVGNYVNISNTFESMHKLNKIFLSFFDTFYGSLKITTIILVFFTVFVYAVYLILFKTYSSSDKKNKYASVSLFVILFSVMSPILTIMGVLLTGNYSTRYLLPIVFFPLLGLIPVFESISFSKRNVIIACLMIPMLSFIAVQFYSAWMYRSTPSMQELECFNNHMIRYPYNVVGGYWTTRKLDLYSKSSSRALQVTTHLRPYLWLNNTSLYESLKFNGVIVDASKAPNHINSRDVTFLGSPNGIVSCGSFDIYYYQDDSLGFNLLNYNLNKNFKIQYEATLDQGINLKRLGLPVFLTNLEGISGNEPWGRWSDADVIKLYFKDHLPKKAELVIKALGFGPNIGQPTQITLGDQKYEITLGKEMSEFRIPFELSNDVKSIQITPYKAISPKELGKGADPRKLGIGLEYLAIKPLS